MSVQINNEKSCFIYINNSVEPVNSIPQRIGQIWNNIKEALEKNQQAQAPSILPFLAQLGLDETVDTAAAFLPILRAALGKEIEVRHSEENSGVYFLCNNGEPFAVFKAGEKRARMDSLVRYIAAKLGLSKQAIPGVFCCLVNPQLPKEDMMSELFNGNQKYFRKVKPKLDKIRTLTGILEPYLETNQKPSAGEFGFLIVLALIIGLRDGKANGIINSTWIDAEDCMPLRFLLESPVENQVPATHLPCLSLDIAKEKIPLEKLQQLRDLIEPLSELSSQFYKDLKNQTVQIADLKAEEMAVNAIGQDHGGNPIEIEEAVQILEEHPKIEFSKGLLEKPLLNEKQINACFERCRSVFKVLKETVDAKKEISALDLVYSVDPVYKFQVEALQKKDSQLSPHRFDYVGHHTPKDLQITDLLQQVRLEEQKDGYSTPRNQQTKRVFDKTPPKNAVRVSPKKIV